jgi:hypothetical protein
MKRGNTLQLELIVRDGRTTAPRDITGWLIWFTVKRYVSDPDNVAVFQARSDDGSGAVDIVQPLIGAVNLTMPALATRGFPDTPTTLTYDVQARDGLGTVVTVEEGSIRVEPHATASIT